MHFPAKASSDISAPLLLLLPGSAAPCASFPACVVPLLTNQRGCRVSARSEGSACCLSQTSFLAPDGSLMVQRLSRLLRTHLQHTSKAAWECGAAGLRQLGCTRAFSSAAPAPVESQANQGFVDGGYKVTDFPQDKARQHGPISFAHQLSKQLPWQPGRALKLCLRRSATSPS